MGNNGFEYPDEDMNRGKTIRDKDLFEAMEDFDYKDVDGDGVPYRTLPDPNGSILYRGTGHDKYGVYSENSYLSRPN